jgi:phenylacetate-CoA ligase
VNLREAAFAAKRATLRRHAGRYFDELLANERLPRPELHRLVDARAVDVATFAVRNTAFYGPWFADRGITLDDLARGDAWDHLPILDRTTLKAHADELRSPELHERTSRVAKTGGTTGEPVMTYVDSRVPLLALAWRMYGWWGIEPWDDLARIGRWGFGRTEALKNVVQWWPTRQVYLDARLFDRESMGRFHRRLVRVRPPLLEGYVGAMLEFADFLESSGLDLPGVRAAATTAAPLTENARRRLESVFGVPVFDEYRGSEVNWMAGECAERDGMHVFADARRIDIVDDEGRPVEPGTVGDIVVTDLTNRVFPMIRYRNGDRAALSDEMCRCGRSLPKMRAPEGRTVDVLRLPSGGALNHGLLGMFGPHPDSVRMFQIHQLSDYSIRIRIVRGPEADAERNIQAAVDTLRERIHGEVPITVEYVDALPYTGGKIKFLISDVLTH